MSPAPVAHPPSARTAASAGTLYLMRILDPGMASEAEMPTCVDGVKRVAPARRLGLVALITDADVDDRSTKRHLKTEFDHVDIFRGRTHGIAAGAAVAVEFGVVVDGAIGPATIVGRSEEHTSELQSLLRLSYAVFCLK